MIKRLILSLVIITGVSASAFAGSKALLNDQVSLTANTFSTGTADLQISVGTDPFDVTHLGFTDTVFPGQTKSKYFRLKNNNSGFPFAISAQSDNISGIPGDKVIISFTPWTSNGGVTGTSGSPEPGAGKTTHTLSDWLAPSSLGIPNIPNGSTQDYKMEVSIDSTVSTTGTSIFNFIFTGIQVNPTPTTTPTQTP